MSAEPAIGTVLAGFRLEAIVARGGMGVVYRATQLSLERDVALKLIAPELGAGDAFRKRFLREARLAASLEHPHVLPVYEAGEADGLLYLAMRLVHGEDLASRLARGPLAPEAARSVLSQVASALQAAHERGLLHRDVKPANVLVVGSEGEEHAFLADFGLAKPLSERGLTETEGFLGSIDYVAPEQIERGHSDARTDVYALGCLLYACATGEPPFRRGHEAATLFAHLRDDPPSGTPFDPVLARALAKDPVERFQSAAAFAQALTAVADVSGRAHGRRRARRRLAAALGAVALLAAALAVLVLQPFEPVGDAAVDLVPHSAVALDSRTLELEAVVPAGRTPTTVVLGGGRVWVLNADDRTISVIDPLTRKVERTIGLTVDPAGIAFGSGALWVADPDGTVVRLDPESGAVAATIRQDIGRADVFGGGKIAFGERSVWVSNRDRTLSRIDPRTNRVTEVIDVGDLGPVVASEGSIWVGGFSRIFRVDPATGSVEESVAVRPGIDGIADLAAGDGSVWASMPGTDLVWRVDAATNVLRESVASGARPVGLDLGPSGLWVAHVVSRTVARVDTESSAVEPIELRYTANDVAVGEDLVWVTIGE